MGVCGSIINKFLNISFLTKDRLIKAISEVKNILPNYHLLGKSEYNLLLEMYIIIISVDDENSSITKVFDFLSCKYIGRYFFDFFLYDKKLIRRDNDIHAAIKLWCSDRDSALAIYGHISFWNTWEVSNMKELFMNKHFFNDNISHWNVSNVTNMDSMFKGAFNFNQPLRIWNVSKVTNMKGMFLRAQAFNQPISSWNVSNVTNMNGMFREAHNFN